MPPSRRRVLFLFSGIAVCLLAGGCSDLINVRGKVTKSGVPFLPANGEVVTVVMYPYVEGGGRPKDSFPANVRREDSSFKVPGKRGKGIPPGKYRFVVEHKRGDSDLLKGAYGQEKSPFIREVTSSEEIILDLDKPQ